jgi:hypothetical protein
VQTYVVTLKVNFEDGRIDSQETAADFLGNIVRQIGEHTVAKSVVGEIFDFQSNKAMGGATYKDDKLTAITADELARFNEGQ